MKDQNNLNLFKSKELEIDKAKTIDEEILKEYVPLTKEQYNYLEKNHGFLESVASYYGLLYSPKERRVVIPVRDKEGNLVSIRRWLLPEHRKEKNDQEKILGYKGHNETVFFPIDQLEGVDPLILCEGERDTLVLISLGYRAITVTNGVKQWRKGQILDDIANKNKEVIIFFDADEPGCETANYVARELSKKRVMVRVVDWPNEVAKGYDVSDLWKEKGPEAVKAVISNSLEWEIETEEITEKANLPKFPIEALSPSFSCFVEETIATNYLTNSVGLLVLSMASHAIGAKRKLKINRTWSILPSISVVCVAPSGTKKSPTLNLVKYPLGRHQGEDKKLGQENHSEKSKVITDTTLEALNYSFSHTEAIAIIKDELKTLFAAFNKYNSGKDEAQSYASLMDGQGGYVQRKKEESFPIPDGRSLVIAGAIQPSLLKRLNPEIIDGGLLARFLFCREENCKLIPDEKDISKEALEAYNETIYRLYDLPDKDDPLVLSEKAKMVYDKFIRDLYAKINDLDEDDPIRPVLAKAEGNMLKIALVLRCCDEADDICKHSDPITEEQVERAIKIINFVIQHTKWVFEEIFETKDKKLKRKVIRFLGKKGTSTVTEINRGVRGFFNQDHVRKVLKQMESEGSVVSKDKRKNRKGEYFECRL